MKELNLKYVKSKDERTKGEIELINDDLTIMIADWGLRYKFILKSLEMLNKNDNLDTTNKLIVNDNSLKLGITQENDFGLAFNLSNTAEIIENYDNTEAKLELELFINKIMINNGIEPFLLKLERNESIKIANIFAKYILENYNQYHIEELINGKIKLENSKIKELENLISYSKQNLIENKG